MKIIVDEMPSCSNDCIFSDGYYACNLLKPITDYVFEERITENISKRTPLADIRNER